MSSSIKLVKFLSIAILFVTLAIEAQGDRLKFPFQDRYRDSLDEYAVQRRDATRFIQDRFRKYNGEEQLSPCNGEGEERASCVTFCSQDMCGSRARITQLCLDYCESKKPCTCKLGYAAYKKKCISKKDCNLLLHAGLATTNLPLFDEPEEEIDYEGRGGGS